MNKAFSVGLKTNESYGRRPLPMLSILLHAYGRLGFVKRAVVALGVVLLPASFVSVRRMSAIM